MSRRRPRSESPPLRRTRAFLPPRNLDEALKALTAKQLRHMYRQANDKAVASDEQLAGAKRGIKDTIKRIAYDDIALRTNLLIDHFQQLHGRRPRRRELDKIDLEAETYVVNDLMNRHRDVLRGVPEGTRYYATTAPARAPGRLLNAAAIADAQEAAELQQEAPPPPPTNAAQMMQEFFREGEDD